MNTTYRARVPSPFQVARKPQSPPVVKIDTVSEEMKKLLGTYQFSATFEEDTQTATTLKHIPGRVIAFICTLKLGEKVIGQGRGTTAINQVNKFIVRNIGFAFNGSFVDAVVRSTKIQDMFRKDAIPHPWNGADGASEESFTGITDKQKSYLLELIQTNVADEDEREGWLSQIGELTKDEASQAIQRFAK